MLKKRARMFLEKNLDEVILLLLVNCVLVACARVGAHLHLALRHPQGVRQARALGPREVLGLLERLFQREDLLSREGGPRVLPLPVLVQQNRVLICKPTEPARFQTELHISHIILTPGIPASTLWGGGHTYGGSTRTGRPASADSA